MRMDLIRRFTLAAALLVLGGCAGLPSDATQRFVQPVNKAAELSVPAPAVATQRPSRLYELAKPADIDRIDLQPGPLSAPVDGFSLEPAPDTRPGTSVFQEFERGGASWYGPGLHGRRTASGERYDMHALTAAHRTLPFGTMVRVRSLVNGREVEVRITDRGPFVRSRIIDVSRAAAVELGMIGLGIKNVALLRLDDENPGRDDGEPSGLGSLDGSQNLVPRVGSGASQMQVAPTAFGETGRRAPTVSSPTRRVVRHKRAPPALKKPAAQLKQQR